jgi:hypothetical protein
VGTAKLLVAAAEREALRDFLGALAGLPGFTPAPDFERGTLGPDDVGPLARLRLGEGSELELIQMPSAGVFAPLWPVLAHRSLGVLLLHSQPAEQSDALLGPIAQALSVRAEPVVVRVMLLRKGERVAADEMQQRLGQLDDTSLFLLPLESGKDPHSLLTTLIHQVLP